MLLHVHVYRSLKKLLLEKLENHSSSQRFSTRKSWKDLQRNITQVILIIKQNLESGAYNNKSNWISWYGGKVIVNKYIINM